MRPAGHTSQSLQRTWGNYLIWAAACKRPHTDVARRSVRMLHILRAHDAHLVHSFKTHRTAIAQYWMDGNYENTLWVNDLKYL